MAPAARDLADYLATHSTEQTLYVGEDGLFRRHDYNVEIAGTAGAHYISGYAKVAGIMGPAKHRIFPGCRTARRSASRWLSRSI